MLRKIRFCFALMIIFVISVWVDCGERATKDLTTHLAAFEGKLENLRHDLKIPAFSAAIVKDKEIIWARGFGYADVEKQVAASESTIYHLASLTKTFASTIIMQLVEQGKLDLDDPISKYNVSLDQAREYGMIVSSEDSIKVRHLFTHTAEGVPGAAYQYNGYLYSLLDNVIQGASGKSFGELLEQEIIQPLNLTQTGPNVCDTLEFEFASVDSQLFCKYAAKPYVFDSLNNVVEWKLETHFSSAAGLMSSVLDLAKYSMAIDEYRFLKKETRERIFTPTISTAGDTLPYGLGWFVQYYKGMKMVWHYGLWGTNSSLIMKIPQKGLTFILLANSNNLTVNDRDVFNCVFAIEFAKDFLLSEENLPRVDYNLPFEDVKAQLTKIKNTPYQDLFVEELFSLSHGYNRAGHSEKLKKLISMYDEVFAEKLSDKFPEMQLVAKIDSVGNGEDRTFGFTVDETIEVHVFAIGEATGGQMWDYGWIENAATGDTVWKMEYAETAGAGGDPKNRMANATIILQPGSYKLRYRSDDSHSYLLWNAMPPEISFYGIALYEKK